MQIQGRGSVCQTVPSAPGTYREPEMEKDGDKVPQRSPGPRTEEQAAAVLGRAGSASPQSPAEHEGEAKGRVTEEEKCEPDQKDQENQRRAFETEKIQSQAPK